MAVNVYLRKGREKPVLNRHPWVFSGAVARIEPEAPAPGSPCELFSADGSWLAAGYVNPRSQITCRLVSWERGVGWGPELLRERVEAAAGFRDRIRPPQTTAFRLVNAEGDGLPGVTVDRYGDGLVMQLATAGADSLRAELAELLYGRFSAMFVYENSTGPLREQEGLPEVRRLLSGSLPDGQATVLEYGHRFLVDLEGGQKTGFYLDQRENRRRSAEWVRPGSTGLNLFSYTGAFAVYQAQAGASRVTSVDSSTRALELARENLTLNGLSAEQHPLVQADVFQFLREDQGQYDLVVLDPPPFARRASHVQKAARAYKDINRLALGRLAPGGVMLTFTCSGHIDSQLFRQIVFAAASEAGREVRVLDRLGAGPDHPVSLFHPEGEYLNGLLLQAP